MNDYRYYRPNRFPPVVKNLLIINVLVFVAQQTLSSPAFDFDNYFALHDVHSVYFKPYQFVTYMFMHGDIMHIFFNMLVLWMFGAQLENVWGPKRFLIFYLACGLGAAALHLVISYIEMAPVWEYIRSFPAYEQASVIESKYAVVKGKAINIGMVGASGSIFGLLAAFGFLFPNSVIYVYFLLPIKAKWFVIILGALELFLGLRNAPGDNVAHFAHIGGAITGIILLLVWNKTKRKTLY